MVKPKSEPEQSASSPARDPNPADARAIAAARTRVHARQSRPSLVFRTDGNKLSVSGEHSDLAGHYLQLLDAFGTCSEDFQTETFQQLINAIRDRGQAVPSDASMNAALAMVAGAAPSNEIEAALASQMAATHSLAMVLVGRARLNDDARAMEANGNLGIKLLRTFIMQAEMLAKLRRGGGQTVRVEHVHVHAGGQAVVGNVEAGGGLGLNFEEQPHAKHAAALSDADASFDPLRRANAARKPVPIASHA